MLKRLITILLLLSFGALPATAHAYNLASLVCQTLEQNEESCCTAEGECHMDMSQMSHSQVETGSSNQCFCDVSEAKDTTGIIASVIVLPALDDSQKVFLPVIVSLEDLQTNLFIQPDPHHKSNKAYLKNTCLRL